MISLSLSEWTSKLSQHTNAIILDVRTLDEHLEGAIPTAIQINVKEPQLFLDAIAKLDASKPFFLYCQSGSRSLEASAVLNLLCNINTTYSLEGGYEAWLISQQS